jgi:hypothetical protein
MTRSILMLAVLLVAFPVRAGEETVLFREDFRNLENWRPLLFPKIPKHSVYSVETQDDQHYLRAESSGSASGLIYKKEFSVYDYPRIRWSWKVDNVYLKGDIHTKSGDDYPIRVYVVFKYDPEQASLLEKLTYQSAKLIYGEYPPHSSLNYVWSSKPYPERILTSPYTDRAKMVLLEHGGDKVGTWVFEEVNVVEDYHRAFGTKPPTTASLAIMSDSDNTGESAVSYVEFIEVYR